VACLGTSATNVTFTPTSLLAANAAYTATLTTGIATPQGQALLSNYTWSFTTAAAPAVTSTIPANGATGVPINRVLTAIFNQAMSCATVATSFTLAGPGGNVSGTVGCAGASATSATFTPTSLLASNAAYTATISSGATNVAGAPLATNYVWTFATELTPTVTSTNPTNLATGVPVNQVLTATLSEQMQCSTITALTFTVTAPGPVSVPGIVACAGTSATFTPTSLLTGSTTYTATITNGATNVAGAPLASNYVWSFATVGGLTVTLTIPPNGATGVPIDQALSAAFSQAVNCATITTSTFTLTGPGGAIGGTITSCAGSTATFTPSADLAINTTYTATLTTGVQEPGGTALAIPYVWTFKTGATPSTTPPMVTAVTPLNGATGVALNTTLTAMFDEAMDPTTMNGSTFTLASGCAPAATTPVTGAVTYNPINNIITLTPGSNLAPLTCFTATVSTGAESLADIAMVAPFVWTFTTGAAADTTPPTVISTSPANLAIDVPLNQLISATFSKEMNDNTINTTTFTLFQGATPIPGTVSYIAGSDTAIFTPTSDLTADTVYTATITTGVSDLAGNFLVNAYVWSFTTAAAPLVVSPTVVSTNPTGNAVCLNAAINATFSTVMDPATINTATFYVTAGGVPVTGTISFTNGTTGTIATFTPLNLLTVSTTYMVTITTGVTDLAGNPLLVDDVWSFTTVATACLAPVPLGAATPFGAFAGGAGMTNQGILTVINGDIGTTGASQTMTGFNDLTQPYIQFSAGCIYTETTLNVGTVNGGIFTAPGTTQPSASCPNEGTPATNAVATEAAADALTAYNALLPVNLPAGAACPGSGNGAGLILAPGVYTCATTFLISGGDLTLDAGNNANAVWVFQVGSALTVGDALPRNVLLINGASAANVFWQVGSEAVINYAGGGTMSGTIIASQGVTLSSPANSTNPTLTVLNGRALGLGAAVTMVNTVINVPGQ
ncbi:MAG: Ig-like domain-containing protein, partial [Terriglobia bacterium]